jgi:hypothetical protein
MTGEASSETPPAGASPIQNFLAWKLKTLIDRYHRSALDVNEKARRGSEGLLALTVKVTV